MKTIDWLLDSREKRACMVFLVILGLIVYQLYLETVFGAAILRCENSTDVIDLTSVPVLRSSFIGRSFFNCVQYAATDSFLWSAAVNTVRIENIILVILLIVYLTGQEMDEQFEAHRLCLFILIILFIIKAGLFGAGGYWAFSSTNTAQGLQRLHTAALILTAVSAGSLIYVLIRGFLSFYHCFLDSHIIR